MQDEDGAIISHKRVKFLVPGQCLKFKREHGAGRGARGMIQSCTREGSKHRIRFSDGSEDLVLRSEDHVHIFI